MTEITIEETPAVVDVKMEAEPKKTKGKDDILRAIQEKMAEPQPKAQCAHHFGYLSQRGNKDKIPEECMICENIVKCMLKAVTGWVGHS